MNRPPRLARESFITERYQVRALAGRGAFSDVFRVHDRLLGRDLALKRFRLRAGGALKRILADEFVLLSRLEHPVLPRVHDFSTDERGRPFFTMDYLAGPSLSGLVKRWGRIRRSEGELVLARYAGRILSALSYIHARGIVHGDIKPSNVLFLEPAKGLPACRELRLVDFGLSGALSQFEGQEARGTPRFMAPEVLRGGPPDAQSDLFSLGLILQEGLDAQREALSADGVSADRLLAFVLRLSHPLRGLRYRGAEEAYGDLLALIEGRDRAAASDLRKSFSFVLRPRSWEPVTASILSRLSECRSGRGGVVVATGLGSWGAQRLMTELRARALASGMTAIRVPVPGRGGQETLRESLASALERVAREGRGDGGGEPKKRADLALQAPSSALATRLSEGSLLAGAAGALWLLEGDGRLSEGDASLLGHLSLALRHSSALLVVSAVASALQGGALSAFDAEDVAVFPDLDAGAIEQALKDVFREIQPRAGLARVLLDVSRGDVEDLNRFLVFLVHSGALRRKQGGWVADPVAVLRLARKLPPPSRTLPRLSPALQIHARSLGTLGQRFDEKTAVAVIGVRPSAIHTVLAELTSSGYLHEQGGEGAAAEWTFTSPGLAEELESQLRASSRRLLHLRALRHLETVEAPGPASRERARHLEGAGRREAAARAYLEIGANRPGRRDILGASADLEHALSLVPARAGPLESEIRFRLAMALQEAGHPDKSLVHLDRLLAESASSSSGADLVALRVAQARNMEMIGRHEEAMRLLEAALADTPPTDLRRRSVIQRARGWVAYLGGLTPQAEELGREAMEVSKASGDRAAIASAHALAGNLLRSSGKGLEAEAEFQKAIEIYRRVGDDKQALTELHNLGIVWIRRDPEKARRILTEVQSESSRLGDDSILASALMNLGIVEKSRGDWRTAEGCYRMSIDVGEQVRFRGTYRAYMNLGTLLTDRGEFEEARTCFDRASRLAAGHQGRIPALFVELNRARLALRRELPEEALAILDVAAPSLNPKHPTTWRNLHFYRSHALAELGRFEEAARAAETAARSAEEQDDETVVGEALLYAGKVDRLSGRKERAREKLGKAAEIFRRHGQTFYAARTSLESAELLATDPGTAKEGLDHAKAAAETFERLGTVPFLTRAQRVRDRLTESVRRGTDAPRELQTLYRVAEVLRAASDLPALLEGLLDAAITLIGAERGMIFLKSEEEGKLVRAASRWLSEAEEKDVMKASQGILKRALADDSPLLTRDAMQDARLRSLKSVIKFEIRSVICAPLRTGETVLGTIYVDHRNPGRFAEKEAEFLRALAGFAAPAILAARARQRLDQEVRGLRQEVRTLKQGGIEAYSPSSIIGTSEAIIKVRDLVERCSRNRSNVLVLGETGTGKDLVARAVHHSGDRAGRAFVSVGGAELQGDLVNADLFGTVEGSATGVKDRAGKFELANGGSIYFHEIEALPLDTQARLLRVIEEPYVERVGGTSKIPVDVRLITASSADLPSLVAAGAFRPDLYYRLNVVSIKISPLRDRREDIAPLLRHYLTAACAEKGIAPLRVPPAVLRECEAYAWPGNVRELRHLAERAVVLGCEEFPPLSTLAGAEMRSQGASLIDETAARDESLESWNALYVERVFDRCGGRKNLACSVLKINYRTLERYLSLRGRGGKKRKGS